MLLTKAMIFRTTLSAVNKIAGDCTAEKKGVLGMSLKDQSVNLHVNAK